MVDVILTVNGGRKITKTITDTKALIGIESGNKLPENAKPQFLDYPFTKEKLGFKEHFDKIKKHKPKYAVAPDLENKSNIEKRLHQAKKIDKYAENTIFITKIKQLHPKNVPDKFIVGIPNQPKFGSNGVHPIWAYRKCEKIHVLGGSPLTYPRYKPHKVYSVDSASIVKAAAFGNYYKNEKWIEDGSISYYNRVKKSLSNIHSYWN